MVKYVGSNSTVIIQWKIITFDIMYQYIRTVDKIQETKLILIANDNLVCGCKELRYNKKVWLLH